jgi:hypothetical protein
MVRGDRDGSLRFGMRRRILGLGGGRLGPPFCVVGIGDVAADDVQVRGGKTEL